MTTIEVEVVMPEAERLEVEPASVRKTAVEPRRPQGSIEHIEVGRELRLPNDLGVQGDELGHAPLRPGERTGALKKGERLPAFR